MKKSSFELLLLCFLPLCCFAQSIEGMWRTIDDRNGKPKAEVQLDMENGLLFAKIIKILEKGKEDARCIKCKGDLKDKPVLGMKIIDGFKGDGKGVFKGKRLFDPEQGMTFRGKVWLDPDDSDKLKVRGYLAFLYRTQTWLRVEEQ